MRAFEGLPALVQQSGFQSWLFSIARNLALDHLDAASRSAVAMDPAVIDERSDHERGAAPVVKPRGIDRLVRLVQQRALRSLARDPRD